MRHGLSVAQGSASVQVCKTAAPAVRPGCAGGHPPAAAAPRSCQSGGPPRAGPGQGGGAEAAGVSGRPAARMCPVAGQGRPTGDPPVASIPTPRKQAMALPPHRAAPPPAPTLPSGDSGSKPPSVTCQRYSPSGSSAASATCRHRMEGEPCRVAEGARRPSAGSSTPRLRSQAPIDSRLAIDQQAPAGAVAPDTQPASCPSPMHHVLGAARQNTTHKEAAGAPC